MKLLQGGEQGFAYLSGGCLRDEEFVETQNAQLGRGFRRDESCRRGSDERWRPSGFGEGVDEAEAVGAAAGDAGSEDLFVSAFGERALVDSMFWLGLLRSARKRGGVDDQAAADGYHRRKLAEDEAISGKQQDRLGKPQLRES